MRRVLIGVVAGALVLSACSGGGEKQAAASEKATSTTKPAPPVAPLTGEADPTGVARKRCAVTVKIDNTKQGHPKYGIEEADVVYEEVVEGGITRLAAIFNSKSPNRVGPVRSVRRTDQSLVAPIKGVFAYSGGAAISVQSIETAPVVLLDESRAQGMMFRDHSRNAPWNLYAHVDQMYLACKDPAPVPLFRYRTPKAAVGGTPVHDVLVGFQAGFEVRWTWDASSGTWKRRIFGGPETNALGVQFQPKNVVIMFANYVGGNPNRGNEGAEAVLTGTGKAQVLTGGKLIEGTWARPDRGQPARYFDGAGKEIRMAPGQTWVELPEPHYSVTVTP